MKERKIVLADGNEVKGYVFKSFLSWYGICWIEGDAVKVELYPADNVVRCEDNINVEKANLSKGEQGEEN